MNTVKDFIYLDSERVRSYLAQIEGKLSETLGTSSSHTVGAKAGAKSQGLTKIIADVEANGSYTFQKTSTETASLHHATFDLLEQKLAKDGLVATTMGDSTPFVGLTGALKVIDYALLAEQIASMSTIIPLINRVSNQVKGIDQSSLKTMKDIAKIIKSLYGEARIMQLLDARGTVIARVNLSETLSLPKSSLLSSTSNEILPGNWTIFGLSAPTTHIATQQETNPLALALEQTSDAMGEIKRLLFGNYEAPIVVPVAIYRKLR